MQILVGLIIVFFFFILFPASVFAATTLFRTAGVITTDGFMPYTNLENCTITDGKTCDRGIAPLNGNLYFRDFGTYSDFGIPQGSTITKVRIRVTGKANIPVLALYVGLSVGPGFNFNCQWPSDLWTMWNLNSSSIKTQTFTTSVTEHGDPQTVNGYCLNSNNSENMLWRINYSKDLAWSANIDNFEIAFDYEVLPTPTPTPTSPPLFDLPWDYEGKGISFNEAALAINSFFDHEYPLLSSGMSEPIDSLGTIVNYLGFPRVDKPYSSHDGYDYGTKARVTNGDPVLAAASGAATYINSCSACGNMILIDHGNGYQTRYLHLQKDGLIISTLGEKVNVNARQQIGKVGATGRVIPEGEKGAHIHFGVFQDKDKDGNFEDNVPDGVTDPFGWQSTEPDPWPAFVFDYGGQRKTGNKSSYLWKKNLDDLDVTLTSNGGVFNTERYELSFPQGSVLDDIKLIIQSSPIVKALDNLRSIGSTIVVNAFDALGNAVTELNQPFTITVDFGSFDLSSYDTDTLSIYSSTDAENWTKEEASVDFVNKTASANLNHLSHFALMAQRIDTIAPNTTATLSGKQTKPNWYTSDVLVTLDTQDNEGGLGVDYTLY